MPCSFPVRVVLSNQKLRVLSLILQGGVGFIFFVRFWVDSRWNNGEMYTGKATSWATGHINTTTVKAQEAVHSLTFCHDLSRFDYQFDLEGHYLYGNYSCMDVCRTDYASIDCVTPYDASIDVAPSKLVVTTSFDERITTRETEGPGEYRHYFTPFLQYMGLSLKFSVEISTDWLYSSQPKVNKVWLSRQLHTVWIDRDWNKRHMHRPGEEIDLPVLTILEYVGLDLDEVNEFTSKNYWPDATTYETGPALRISGIEIVLEINCFNYDPGAFGELDINEISIELPVCFIRPWRTTTGWITNEKTEVIGATGAYRHRRIHGVFFDVIVHGTARKFDPTTIMNDLASVIVFMRIPNQVLLFFAITFLGHLSLIYKKAVYQNFSIVNQCAGLSMRLMAHSIAFNDAEDTSTHNVEGGFSKLKVGSHLKHILSKRSNLGTSEVNHMVDFCWTAVTTPHQKAKFLHEWFLKLCRRTFMRAEQINEPMNQEYMDIDSYSNAIASNERIGFNELVKLFDSDRKRSCLEHIFTPVQVKESLKASKGAKHIQAIEHTEEHKALTARKQSTKNKADSLTTLVGLNKAQVNENTAILSELDDKMTEGQAEIETLMKGVEHQLEEAGLKILPSDIENPEHLMLGLGRDCAEMVDRNASLERRVVAAEADSVHIQHQLYEVDRLVKQLAAEAAEEAHLRAQAAASVDANAYGEVSTGARNT